MADEWQSSTVGDLLAQSGGEIKTGPFGTKLKASEYSRDGTGVPVISVGEVGYGRLQLHDKTPRVDESVTSRMPEYLLREGDIVFGRKGAVERSAFVQKNQEGWFLGSDGIRLRVPQSCTPRYIAYLLQSTMHREWMVQHAAGSTMPSLNEGIIKRIPLLLAPEEDRKAIARILGALDDKIELNRRRSRTLEAMARAVFQSWFVDFDPVKAKAEGHTTPGLSADVAAIFPDRFEDSAIGKVPCGWKVERFADHLTADRGLSYKGEGLREDGTGVPMHNLNSILEGGGYKHIGIKHYAGEYREKHLLVPGDLIVTNTEQGFDHLLIGYAAIVPEHFGPTGIYSHHIYRIRPKETSPFDSHYLVELINSRRWHDWISGFSNGTTINMLPLDAMEKPLLAVPPPKLVKHYSELAKAAHDLVEDNRRESATLAALRDTLLPKLVSGELRVADAERSLARST